MHNNNNNFNNASKKEVRERPLQDYMYSWYVFLGQIVSDGNLEPVGQTTARITWSFGHMYKAYADWLYALISVYCKSGVSTLPSGQHRLKTVSLPQFYDLRILFYTYQPDFGWVKVIPAIVTEIMNDVILAHIIIGDGSWNSNTVIIYTNAFSKEDCQRLADSITAIGIKTTVRKERVSKTTGIVQYKLAVSRRSLKELRKQVVPHMHSSMLKRVGL